MSLRVARAPPRRTCVWVRSRTCPSEKHPRAFAAYGRNFFSRPREEVRLPRRHPPVQKCEMKFRVVFLDSPALFHCPPGRADAKSQVPQRAREFRDERPEFLFHLVATE